MDTKKLTRIAMIAAVYTALCFAPGLNMIAFGQIQVRLAEALTMLPLIYQPAIAGVTLGCFLSNLIGAMTGLNPTGMLDSVIGTAATLLAAYFTWKFRDRKVNGIPVLSILMPVVFNFFFVGAELAYLFMPDSFITGLFINGFFVAVGEIIACTLGYILVRQLAKKDIFKE
ncbi:MAG: QueT transporter family protein [Solobacterium sp.]|nr:QueT transporter family protein [Solobacterium sp.]